jgi:two-component system, sensor histidine kinase LadS
LNIVLKFAFTFFLFLVGILPIFAQSQNTFIIRQNRDYYKGAFDYLQIVEDKTQKLSIEQVRTEAFQKNFRPITQFAPLNSQSIYWAKWEVENQTDRDTEWYLHFIQKFNICALDGYIVESHNQIMHKRAGMYVPQSQLPSTEERFKLHFRIAKAQKITIYMRVSTFNNYSPRLDFILEQPIYSLNQTKTSEFGQIFIQGCLWILALYNLLLFISARDRTYLYYVIYLMSLGIYLLFQHNFLFKFILSEYPQSTIFLNATAEEWAQIAYLLFLQSFFETKQKFPPIYHLINGLVIFIGLKWGLNMLILFFWFNVFLSDILLTLPTFLVFGFLIYILVQVGKNNSAAGFLVLLGSLVLLVSVFIGLVLGILIINQTIQTLTFTDATYIIEFGVVVEIICFSLGLGVRNKQIELEKRQAQEAVIVWQKQINEELEYNVRLRTQEIEEANAELEAQQVQFKHLNENLEKEITKRTKELKIAIENLVEQNQDLEEFSQIISHNIRAPVAHILGLTSIINKENPHEESNIRLLDYIEKSAQNLDMVIKDLDNILNIQNRVEKIKEKINLSELLNKIARQLQPEIQAAQASLKFNIEPIDTFFSLQSYLVNILHQLIGNALKYRAQERDLVIEVQATLLDDEVCIVIKDNGVGINTKPENLNKIFGLYKRMHDHVEGKGLGLYIVKTQVQALQGKIEVESGWREGTTFKVFLPVN